MGRSVDGRIAGAVATIPDRRRAPVVRIAGQCDRVKIKASGSPAHDPVTLGMVIASVFAACALVKAPEPVHWLPASPGALNVMLPVKADEVAVPATVPPHWRLVLAQFPVTLPFVSVRSTATETWVVGNFCAMMVPP